MGERGAAHPTSERSVAGVVETTLFGALLPRIGVGIAVGGVVVPLGVVGVTAVVRCDVGAVLTGVSVDVSSNRGRCGQSSKTNRGNRSADKQGKEASHGLALDTGQ